MSSQSSSSTPSSSSIPSSSSLYKPRLASSQITTLLKECKTLDELRLVAKEHKERMDGIHDNAICCACAKLVSIEDSKGRIDDKMRAEARKIYSISLRNWLNRVYNSKGHDARCCANIMHAGAKLNIDASSPLYHDLCDMAMIKTKEFNPQEVSNCLWSVATQGVQTSGAALVPLLISRCIEKTPEFEAQEIANCLWSVASLGVKLTGEKVVPILISRCIAKASSLLAQHVSSCIRSVALLGVSLTGTDVITALFSQCTAKAADFDAQGISNCLWSIATLQISNKDIVHHFFAECIKRIKDFNSQGMANCLWAVAKLGDEFINTGVVDTLLNQLLVQRKSFNAPEASMTLWSLASLRISDDVIVQEVLNTCLNQLKHMSAQHVAICLFSIATLGEETTGKALIPVWIKGCLEHYTKFNEQDIANCLWALASLRLNFEDDKDYQSLSSAVIVALETRYRMIIRVDEASQCLQAHYSGLYLSSQVVTHLRAILQKNPQSQSTTVSQDAVVTILTRLGYFPRKEVAILDGLVSVDIIIDLASVSEQGKVNAEEKSAGATAMPRRDIAIEFDGPWHFMRKKHDSKACVGPIDGRTRMRNSLITKSGLFEALLVIPFYEWDEVWHGKNSKLNGSSSRGDRAMLYVKKKIATLMGSPFSE